MNTRFLILKLTICQALFKLREFDGWSAFMKLMGSTWPQYTRCTGQVSCLNLLLPFRLSVIGYRWQ